MNADLEILNKAKQYSGIDEYYKCLLGGLENE
jgi:hypothetical protein